MVSYHQLDLYLAVYMRKETAIYIIHSEQVVFFSDQCVFFDESRVYEVSHGP